MSLPIKRVFEFHTVMEEINPLNVLTVVISWVCKLTFSTEYVDDAVNI
jgi:hypothetical protein